jgi:hypothetical protein
MSTPTGDNAFLHALELTVRTELTLAETGQPWEEAVRVPIDEWLSDPADDQRYEAGLRSLLGAVEAVEDGSGPGNHPPPADVPESHCSGAFPQQARMGAETEGRLAMRVTRQHVVEILRTARLPDLAEEALRVLPDPVEYNDAARFLFQYGITKDNLISRMGGSP